MRAEYFSRYESFTNKHFGSGPYIFNLSEIILSIKFFDVFSSKRRGYPIFNYYYNT